jgi:tetratricopeptide (TPR) repeat protein
MAAYRDAVARNGFAEQDLWPWQAMAEFETGNSERALARITPLLAHESRLPLETLLFVWGVRLNSVEKSDQENAIQLLEALIDRHQDRDAENAWQIPVCGAMAHSNLADAYKAVGDWPRVAHHGRRAVLLVEQSLQHGEIDFRGNDVRDLSKNAIKCANAYFHLRDFDQSRQMASLAIRRFRERLKDKPQEQGQRRNLSQALYHLAEAEYFAGREHEARRACDESIRNLRELLTSDVTDHELDDRLKLCGMLTRNPFSTSAAPEELHKLSQRLLELAPDDPVVGQEVAWVEYRGGNPDGAQGSFLRFLESSEANDELRRIALAGCALAEYDLDNEEAARDFFRRVVEAFEQLPDETVFRMQEHSTLIEVARKLGREAVVDSIFAEQ